MTSQKIPAGIWVRVSTADQTEANQTPDIMRHCDANGYDIARKYELNDKSASKGEQQAKLDEMVADMREGTIRVLVCWHSDRLERRGPEALFKLLRQVKDAGGRIESVKEPLLGTTDLSGEALTALNSIIARQYSVHLGEQVKIGHATSRANNALAGGGAPWGYEVVGTEKHHKTIVPTDLCRTIVPEIFRRCTAGDSCRTIARWLQSEGIPTMRGGSWSDGSVHRILTNATYAGHRQDEGDLKADGKPSRKNRQTVMTCEAVIGMATYRDAQEALKNRPQRGPQAPLPDRPLLALRCLRCDAPMYRTKSGREVKTFYYRCRGHAPEKKGCGNMVPVRQTDFIITERIIITSTEPYRTRTWAEGQNHDDEIAEVKQQIREAADAERFADLPPLQAKLAELRAQPTTPGHWDYQDVRYPNGRIMTVGELFERLNDEGRRAYLAACDIKVDHVVYPEPGAKNGLHVVIDGTDHGVFPYPPNRLFTK